MVQHLWFLLSLDYQPLYLMNYLMIRRLCCASVYLRILVTHAWCIFGVPWPPFCQIHPSWVFRQRLHSVLYGRSQACLLGVSLLFFGALPENIMGSPSRAFSDLQFFGEIIFSGRAPWPLEPLGTGILVLDRVFSLTSLTSPTWKTAWYTKGSFRTWQDWYSCCRDLFRSLDQMYRSWKIPVLLLFDCQLSLVLSLLGIGLGEEIKF